MLSCPAFLRPAKAEAMAERKKRWRNWRKKYMKKSYCLISFLVFSCFFNLDYMILSFYDNYVKAKQNICENIEKIYLQKSIDLPLQITENLL